MTKAPSLVAALLGLTMVLGAARGIGGGQVGLLDPCFGGDGKVTMNFDPPGAVRRSRTPPTPSPSNRTARSCSPAASGAGSTSSGAVFDGHRPVRHGRFARRDVQWRWVRADALLLGRRGARRGAASRRQDRRGGSRACGGRRTCGRSRSRDTNSTEPWTRRSAATGESRRCRGASSRSSVAVQPDGKIVAAGDGIVRYETDGSLDMGFGVGGRVDSPFMTDVAIQPDGRIVTAGFAFAKFGVYRYETDGTPDMTFDGDGKATVAPTTGSAKANGLALQPNGKIVVAGAYREPGIRRFALGRLTASGAVDQHSAEVTASSRRGSGASTPRPGPPPRNPTAGSSWLGHLLVRVPCPEQCRRVVVRRRPLQRPRARSTVASAATARS